MPRRSGYCTARLSKLLILIPVFILMLNPSADAGHPDMQLPNDIQQLNGLHQPGDIQQPNGLHQPGDIQQPNDLQYFVDGRQSDDVQSSDKLYNFEFDNVLLDQALLEISRRTGIELIYVSEITAGIQANAVFQDEPVDVILDELLMPAGLEARRIRTGIYLIRYLLRGNMEPVRFPRHVVTLSAGEMRIDSLSIGQEMAGRSPAEMIRRRTAEWN